MGHLSKDPLTERIAHLPMPKGSSEGSQPGSERPASALAGVTANWKQAVARFGCQ